MPNELYLNLSILGGSLAAGVILQVWVMSRLRRAAELTRWKGDDLIIAALGKLPLLWCVCGGAYAVLLTSRLGAGHRHLVEKLLTVVVIFSVTVAAARLVGGMVEMLAGTGKGGLASTSLFVSGSRLLIYLIGGVIILQNLEIEITPLITALGLGGLAVALALEETLNNLFCGVQIIAARLVRPGDYVKLDSGYAGYVTDIKARNTTILSFPENNRIIVPNSALASAIVVNYNLPQKSLWVTVTVGVAYDSDLEQVERVTLEVAREIATSVEGGIPDHEPVLRYDEFADSSINFTLRMFVKEFRDQFLIKHEFIKKLHQRYNEEGIEIPFPNRTVYLKQGKADS